jgi:hypothetical protein
LVDGGGDADVYVRVDPAPPAVDPNPSNDETREGDCVAECVGLAAQLVPGEAGLDGFDPSRIAYRSMIGESLPTAADGQEVDADDGSRVGGVLASDLSQGRSTSVATSSLLRGLAAAGH